MTGHYHFLVHRLSYHYVKNVADYILAEMQKSVGARASMTLCDDVGEHTFDRGSTIFVLGDVVGTFARTPACAGVHLS